MNNIYRKNRKYYNNKNKLKEFKIIRITLKRKKVKIQIKGRIGKLITV